MKPDAPLYRFVAYQVVPASPQMESDVLCILASLTARMKEPTSDIVQVAQKNAILPVSVEHFEEFPGRGVGGFLTLPRESGPRTVLFGTRDFVTQCRLTIPELLNSTIQQWKGETGVTVSYLGWEGSVRAAVKFQG